MKSSLTNQPRGRPRKTTTANMQSKDAATPPTAPPSAAAPTPLDDVGELFGVSSDPVWFSVDRSVLKTSSTRPRKSAYRSRRRKEAHLVQPCCLALFRKSGYRNPRERCPVPHWECH